MRIVAIDNGTTGAIGFYDSKRLISILEKIPIIKEAHYTKKRSFFTRIDVPQLAAFLQVVSPDKIFIERPYTGAYIMTASSAMGAYHCTLAAIDIAGSLAYETVDSKKWQKSMLGNVKNTKEVSKLKGIALFPHLKDKIKKQKDADAILMAYYYAKT